MLLAATVRAVSVLADGGGEEGVERHHEHAAERRDAEQVHQHAVGMGQADELAEQHQRAGLRRGPVGYGPVEVEHEGAQREGPMAAPSAPRRCP